MITISVAIPIYNTANYLKDCIESLINQADLNQKFQLEIILINDGSTDETHEICTDYEKNYSFIKYFYKENQGPSKSRNLGINLATGDYIYFMDSDDTLNNTFFSSAIDEIKKNKQSPDIIIVATNIFNQSRRTCDKITCCATACTIINFNFLRKQNIKFNIDLKNYEDVLFHYQLLSQTQNIIKSNNSLYNYNKQINNRLSNKIENKKYHITVFEKLLNEIEKFYLSHKNEKIKDHTTRAIADIIFYKILTDKYTFQQRIKLYSLTRHFLKRNKLLLIDISKVNLITKLFYIFFEIVFLI